RGAKRARTFLEAGFTSIKDLGNSGLYLDVALRDAIKEGSVEGPRVFASGPILAATGGQIYGLNPSRQKLADLEYRVIKGVEDAKLAVREHLNQRVDLIKICADNLPNNTRLSREEMEAIVNTAHSYGLKVSAHSIINQSAWEAVMAGVDGIEHGFYLADSTLQLMAEKQVYLVPTENSRDYMDTYYGLAGTDPAELGWLESYFSNMKDRLNRARENGVTVVAGSDNYNDMGVSPGRSSLDMFRAYIEMGMQPLDILQSATYLSALQLGKEKELGVLKVGAFADIIAVKGNIEENFLQSIEEVSFVMKDGKVYVREED
ncbi:MAG: amidohydrolase family protein, partial [Flavobacteriaceae bacterium]|nr:amidohydrolase family protein [Flavobacteriaceae bacterium]